MGLSQSTSAILIIIKQIANQSEIRTLVIRKLAIYWKGGASNHGKF